MKPLLDHDRAAYWIGGLVGSAAYVFAVQYYLALSSLQLLAFAGLLGLSGVVAIVSVYGICFKHNRTRTHEAEQAGRLHLATVEALATAIDAKDQTTHCHVRRVQVYAAGLGKQFNLSEPELAALSAGALLHDIGKLAVPDHILNKPGALTPSEFERTKVHTVIGAEILGRVDFPFPVIPIVRHHHERWDGYGYPDELKGELIPITARIMSVVDCFDSVREERPFRSGMTREQAIELLRKGSGTHFDPTVVERFIEHLPQFEREISARGLAEPMPASNAIKLSDYDVTLARDNAPVTAYDQIRNAHREVYALYEIARSFGSSLEIESTLAVLVDKVGHIVGFDTCVVYLYDELKGFASAALAVGPNANAFKSRCVAPGEGVTGFALANRRAINRLHPSLDCANLNLADERQYRSMASLPLFKDDLLLGALSVYSTTLPEYSDDHLRLLETVTHLASDALANAMHHARAESNALTDSLTGLPNARSLHVRFEEEVARTQRTGKPFQVIMLDLDHFKLVNDTFGHKIGDRMLRDVASLIHRQLREYDFLARYAGDEFVAIVPGLEGQPVDELSERIEAVVSAFALHVRADTHARVGISVGSAIYGTDGETLDHLLIAADQAMYRVKSAHRIAPPLLAEYRGGAPKTTVKAGPAIGPKALISTAIN